MSLPPPLPILADIPRSWDPRTEGARCDECPWGPTSPFLKHHREKQKKSMTKKVKKVDGTPYEAPAPRGPAHRWSPVRPELHPDGHIAGVRVLAIGSHPGPEEATEGRPFVGLAGQELMDAMNTAGVTRPMMSFDNAAACAPPNGDLEYDIAQIDRHNAAARKLRKEIGEAEAQRLAVEEDDPRIRVWASPFDCCAPRVHALARNYGGLLLLGAPPKTMFMGEKPGIMDVRGGPVNIALMPSGALIKEGEAPPQGAIHRWRALPTVNPAFVRRYRRWRQTLRKDIARAVRFFSNQLDWKPPVMVISPTPEQLRAFLKTGAYKVIDIETLPGEPWKSPQGVEGSVDAAVPVDIQLAAEPEDDRLDDVALAGMTGDEARGKGVKPSKKQRRQALDPLRAVVDRVAVGNRDVVYLVRFISVETGERFVPEHQEAEVWQILADFARDPGQVKVGWNENGYDSPVLARHFALARAGVVASGAPSGLTWEAELNVDGRLSPTRDLIIDHRLVEGELPHNLAFVASQHLDSPAWKAAYHAEEDGGTDADRDLYCCLDVANTDRLGAILVPATSARGQDPLVGIDHMKQSLCLSRQTQVLLPGGKAVPIWKLVKTKYSGFVMAWHPKRGVVRRRVVNWKKTRSPGQQWVVVRTSADHTKTRGLVVTPDHQCFTTDGWKEAGDLKPGDSLLLPEKGWDSTQLQAILGSLLGDGVLARTDKRNKGIGFQCGHARASRLAEWKCWRLGLPPPRKCPSVKKRLPNGSTYIAEMDSIWTGRRWQLQPLRRLVYRGERGRVRHLSPEVLEACGPIGLAWWFMDDGWNIRGTKNRVISRAAGEKRRRGLGAKHGKPFQLQRVAICVGDFAIREIRSARRWLMQRFGGSIRISGPVRNKLLIFDREASVGFCSAIAEHIFPDLRYKLLQDAPLPAFNGAVEVRPLTPVFVPIEAVNVWTSKSPSDTNWRYCLSVRGANFFTPHGLVHNCMDMHALGVRVDQQVHDEMEATIVADSVKWLREAARLAGKPVAVDELGFVKSGFNANSGPQVGKVLYDEWGLTIYKRTDHGAASTDDECLIKLFTDPEVDNKTGRPFVRAIRKVRKGSKKRGTYMYPTRPWFRGGSVWPDGRIRPNWLAHTVISGRLSCSDFPMQGMPIPLRTMFAPEQDCAYCKARGFCGVHAYVSADADQLELRIVTAVTGCAYYLNAFAQRWDPHGMLAELVWGDAYRNAEGYIDPKTGKKPKKKSTADRMRGLVKRVVYATIYSAKIETVWEQIVQAEDSGEELIYPDFTIEQATVIVNKWKELCPEIVRWWDETVQRWRAHRYVRDYIFGRRRDCLDSEMDEEELNTMVNFEIQCTGASHMDISLMDFRAKYPIHFAGPNTGIIGHHHDSLLVECPVELAETCADDLQRSMTRQYPTLPGLWLTAESDVKSRWAPLTCKTCKGDRDLTVTRKRIAEGMVAVRVLDEEKGVPCSCPA